MNKVYKNPGPLTFSGKILTNSGGANYIEFPYDLKEIFGYGNLIPFKATFDNHAEYRGSLAKMGGDCAMILLRKDVFAQLDKKAGDTVAVLLELDDKPRELTIAADVKTALESAGLWEQFNGMAYTHRKEYVQWIESAKKPETRSNRIDKMCQMLVDGKKDPR